MTTKKQEKMQKNVLSKGARILIGLGFAVVCMFMAYIFIWINMIPAILKGYYIFAVVLAIVFVVVIVMFIALAITFLSNKSYKQML